MVAKIYQPAKTSMQSGMARTKNWVLEFEASSPKVVEPLMGWTSSTDMNTQVRLKFASKADAVSYAERHGLEFEVSEPHKRISQPKAYSDNFRFGRYAPWTH